MSSFYYAALLRSLEIMLVFYFSLEVCAHVAIKEHSEYTVHIFFATNNDFSYSTSNGFLYPSNTTSFY